MGQLPRPSFPHWPGTLPQGLSVPVVTLVRGMSALEAQWPPQISLLRIRVGGR